MFSWLKKNFIPHQGNDHRPNVLRNYSVLAVLTLLLFVELFSFLLPTLSHINLTGNMAEVLPAVLADLTNQERQDQNLPLLTISPLLNEAAQMKAEDMATNGYFAHISPDGKTPWYWLEKVGYQYQYAGENLAVNFTDSQDVTNAWMASPTHRANIEKTNYTEVGSGVATGMYQGREAIFAVQDYANPLSLNSAPVATTQTQNIKTERALSTNSSGSSNVLGASVIAVTNPTPNITSLQLAPQPTFWQKLFASPRNTTNLVLYIVFGIFLIALLLYIVIKMKDHHKDLIRNGLILLVFILAIYIANYYLSSKHMLVESSLNYTNLSK